jgi:hypothetical protein
MTAEHGLAMALHVAANCGWAPLPLVPLQKAPVNKGLFDNPPRTPAEVHAAWAKAIRTIHVDDRVPNNHRGCPPGIGILLGASRVWLLDADTPAEVDAWKAVCGENGFDPGPPTVLTPGARGADGAMKHIDGGHWYFTQPEDFEPPAGEIKAKIALAGSPHHAVLYGGRHIAVVPPTTRETGTYVSGGGTIQPAPEFLRRLVDASTQSTPATWSAPEDSLFGTSEYHASAAEWEWDDATDWLDVLPEGWTESGEDRDGHIIYARPGGSSSRSAHAHPAGCSHFPNANAPPPMTFFSSESGDFLDALQLDRGHGGTTVGKLKLYALLYFDGDVAAAREALGIVAPTRVEVSAPPLDTISDVPTIRLEDVPVDQLPDVDWEELGLEAPPQLLRHRAQQAAAESFDAYHPDLATEVSAEQKTLWDHIRWSGDDDASMLAWDTGVDEITIGTLLSFLEMAHPRPLINCRDGGWRALDADGHHACPMELVCP